MRGGVNMTFEEALRNFSPKDDPQPVPGMSQLIEEDGTRGPIVTTSFAMYWISFNPEWKREEL